MHTLIKQHLVFNLVLRPKIFLSELALHVRLKQIAANPETHYFLQWHQYPPFDTLHNRRVWSVFNSRSE